MFGRKPQSFESRHPKFRKNAKPEDIDTPRTVYQAIKADPNLVSCCCDSSSIGRHVHRV